MLKLGQLENNVHNGEQKHNNVQKDRKFSGTENITNTLHMLDAEGIYLDGCSFGFFIINFIINCFVYSKAVIASCHTIITVRTGVSPLLSCIVILFYCCQCSDLEL